MWDNMYSISKSCVFHLLIVQLEEKHDVENVKSFIARLQVLYILSEMCVVIYCSFFIHSFYCV